MFNIAVHELIFMWD